MFSRIEPNSTSGVGRLLARQLAREMTEDEVRLIAGGTECAGYTGVAGTSTGNHCGGDMDNDGDCVIGHR